MAAVECATSWGERVRLSICADRYERGGELALLALNVTDPGDEERYLGLWDVLTVNLQGDSVAASWCSERGRVVVDANSAPAALVDVFVGANVDEMSGRSVRSGFCFDPLATVPPHALAGLRGYEETARELAQLAIVAPLFRRG